MAQELLPTLLHTARCYKIKGLDMVQDPGCPQYNVSISSVPQYNVSIKFSPPETDSISACVSMLEDGQSEDRLKKDWPMR